MLAGRTCRTQCCDSQLLRLYVLCDSRMFSTCSSYTGARHDRLKLSIDCAGTLRPHHPRGPKATYL
eukprot:3652506-Prymnesium_polylepis.2